MSWAFPNGANSGWNSPSRGVSCPNGPESGQTPKADPPGDPPLNFKKFHREAMSNESGYPKPREFRLELAESRHIVPEWTTHRGAVCGQGWADPVLSRRHGPT